MKFKLKVKQANTQWTETFVWWKKTQDGYLVILDRVWCKFDLTTNRNIYRANR